MLLGSRPGYVSAPNMIITGRHQAIEEGQPEKKDNIAHICSGRRYCEDAGYDAEWLEKACLSSAGATYPGMHSKAYNQKN